MRSRQSLSIQGCNLCAREAIALIKMRAIASAASQNLGGNRA
ncbi:hypothetical protein [Trichocoleus sp. DQ-U1]